MTVTGQLLSDFNDKIYGQMGIERHWLRYCRQEEGREDSGDIKCLTVTPPHGQDWQARLTKA